MKNPKDTMAAKSADIDENGLSMGEVIPIKKPFSRLTIFALTVVLMSTWEALSSTMSSGLVSGGPVSLIYGFLLAIVGSMATAASLGEMVSMYPTAGGQYHFIAKFAPNKWQNILSWSLGWIGTFGWVSFTASAPYLAAGMIQGLVVLTCETYQPQRWHLSMIYWALVGLSTALNIWGSRLFSLVETASLIIHLVGFLVVLIVMWVCVPIKHDASFVFTTFLNSTGWPSNGLSWCLGMLSSCYVLAGYDGAIHLCEEMANPETAVPYCMLGSLAINDILGFVFLLTILFCMGDMESALQTPTDYPIIEIFRSVTRSLAGSCALTAVLIIAAWLGTIALLASTARMVLSLARDRALPFSTYLSQLDSRTDLPKRAIITTSCLLILFGLINIASTTAFNAILSLAVLGLHISYLVPIVFFLWRRLSAPHSVSYGPWRLGRAGIAINVVAIMYLLFTSIFMVFPSYQPVTPSNMNYASLIFGFVCLMSTVFWLVRGRKEYDGPVVAVNL
ncbi:GABA permease [Aspergillus eucalypticola CBS 122712]|uniref:GABA permease n=1 Tax=Aspergillus eucalypticola (strain CBS 122712 / IBT 29274) TaxID=1448314 RepID=A0A317UX64_ASPEC|nr:GABA permease [Aspergillus eucalypticola CBS 122712]PWY64570.1 GABA permease [Aspergillus eucalypticola CBS 122712]